MAELDRQIWLFHRTLVVLFGKDNTLYQSTNKPPDESGCAGLYLYCVLYLTPSQNCVGHAA